MEGWGWMSMVHPLTMGWEVAQATNFVLPACSTPCGVKRARTPRRSLELLDVTRAEQTEQEQEQHEKFGEHAHVGQQGFHTPCVLHLALDCKGASVGVSVLAQQEQHQGQDAVDDSQQDQRLDRADAAVSPFPSQERRFVQALIAEPPC